MAYYILKSYKLRFEPAQIFAAFKNYRNCFFLDSSLNFNSLGRYSFLGIEPFYTLKTKNQDPFPRLREIIEQYKISLPKNNLPFLGGAVGYLSYDLGLILEKKIKSKPKADIGIPDCFFGFYNTLIIIDHLKQLLYVSAIGFPERKYRLAKSLCECNFRKTHKLLSKITDVQKPILNADIRKSSAIGGSAFGGNADLRRLYSRNNLRPSACPEISGSRRGAETKNYIRDNLRESALKDIQIESNFKKEDYLSAIKRAKEYIRKGDIYQVNLSQQFMAKSPLSDFQIYERLRRISPSYFSAYFNAGGFQILSSSPERFLRLENNIVITRPMKGTRPRGRNRIRDTALKKKLLKSAKDKAELVMIVDLERNDLGRVCSYDSVRVATLRELEEYSTVFQTTATVEGRLHKDKDRIDLLRACFPGGSITGCPKIRAMEIIEELEPSRRAIYTGALGYLSFSGSMDFNILIRTILKKEDWLYFSVGGGIVTDSKPEDEYQETLVKARAMMQAIA